MVSLRWRHNEGDGVSYHQPRDCLLNRLFRHRSKKASKPRVTGLCEGNSPVTGEFHAQMACNAKMFPFDDVIIFVMGQDDIRSNKLSQGRHFNPLFLRNVACRLSLKRICFFEEFMLSKFPIKRMQRFHLKYLRLLNYSSVRKYVL